MHSIISYIPSRIYLVQRHVGESQYAYFIDKQKLEDDKLNHELKDSH